MKISQNFVFLTLLVLICVIELSHQASVKGKNSKKVKCEELCGKNGTCVKQDNTTVCKCADGSLRDKKCPKISTKPLNVSKPENGKSRITKNENGNKKVQEKKVENKKKNKNLKKDKKTKDENKQKMKKNKNKQDEKASTVTTQLRL